MSTVDERSVKAALERRAERVIVRSQLDEILSGDARAQPEAGHDRRGAPVILAVAAITILLTGTAGLMWIQQTRSEPSSAADWSRTDGVINDALSVDFAAWLQSAPEWPPEEPAQYLVFDIAQLDGWTVLDESGSHLLGQGGDYIWSANLVDASDRRFSVSLSQGEQAPNASEALGLDRAAESAAGGQIAWKVDSTHTATVIEFGTTNSERAIALARALTTTMVTDLTVAVSGDASATETDAAEDFAGRIDNTAWSVSRTPDAIRFVVEGVAGDEVGIDDRTATNPRSVQLLEVGNNNSCVFIAALINAPSASPRLRLSDDTRITVPTLPSSAGATWFAACIPYALDAVAVEVTLPDGTTIGTELDGPYLRPTTGIETRSID